MKKEETNATAKKGYDGKPLYEKDTGEGLETYWEDYDPDDVVKNNHDRRVRNNRYNENTR